MEVEFVGIHSYDRSDGIGRYVSTMAQYLRQHLSVSIRMPQLLPGSQRFSPLQYLPIGISEHRANAIVHFPQIMGCAIMLWRPYHPSVATVHDLGVLELPEEWQMLDPIARQLLRLSLAGLRKVDHIIAVSEFTRQGVIDHLHISPDRVTTVHSGIDHALFRPVPDAERALVARYPYLANCGRPWLLYIGSELPRKNLRSLLEALAVLKQNYPHLHLLKVGAPGGEHFRTETKGHVERLNLGSSVQFLERVPEEDLPLFYSAADLFIQPSKLEGFGFPVLEAMACGTPVVCSNAGSLPEITGDAAVVTEATADCFLAALLSLLSNMEECELRRAAGLKQVQRFHWSSAGEGVLDLYRRIRPEVVKDKL